MIFESEIFKFASAFLRLAENQINENFEITPQEQKIFSLLMSVVREKSPDTILRVAGGWVRDKLLGKQSNDIDIAISNMSGEKFAHLVAQYMKENDLEGNGGIAVVKENPDQSKNVETAIMKIYGLPIDFVGLRKETYPDPNSRIPVVTEGTIEEDAARRDLTINALFYNINEGKVEDLVGGVEDLKKGVARTPIDPVQTFLDDPLRILRAIRFAAKYNLDVAPEMIEAAKKPEVKYSFKNKVTQERIWQELAGKNDGEKWKPGFMAGPDPYRAALLLKEFGLTEDLLNLTEEEMEDLGIQEMNPFETEQNNPNHDLNIWEHTLKVLEHLVKHETTESQQQNAEDFLVRNLAALLHDIGKRDLGPIQKNDPQKYTYKGHVESSSKIAEKILRRMRAPSRIIERVKKLIEAHMRLHLLPDDASDKSLRRFLRDLADDWRNSLDLAISDAYGKKSSEGDETIRERYKMFEKRINEYIEQMGGTSAKPPLNGKDLIEMGFKPGKAIGEALRALNKELLERPSMTKEEAKEFIYSLGLL